MALVKGTNSYATLAEAELYFLDRIDVSAWTAADDTRKSQALITATGMLDLLSWSGGAVSESQPLAFPRDSFYFDPRIGVSVSSSITTPTRIINATFELAYHLINNEGLLDNTGLIKDLNVGGITLSTIRPASKMPLMVKRLIRPLLQQSNAMNSWWRAN